MTKEPVSPPKRSMIPVVICGSHPHSGRNGWIPLTNGIPETINMFGHGMVRVEFHDGTGCYAEQHHVQTISSPPPPKGKT